MTNIEVLTWIKKNLSPYIVKSIANRPYTFCTEEILAGVTMRETGDLIARFAVQYPDPLIMAKYMKGDFGQRKNDTAKIYHGFGFTQIDIASFPQFVSSGDWMNPYNCYSQSIAVLENNRLHILNHNPVLKGSTSLVHYSIAAYNCGAGNEDKVILQHLDPDAYTTGHNYSKAVFEFAETYKSL